MTPGPGKYGDTSSWRTWAPAGPPASNWPPVLSEKFDQLMAASLSRNTWSSLKSVVSVVKQTAAEFDVDLDLPWGESKLMTFLVASSCRKLKSATCNLQIMYSPDVLCTAAQRGTADNPDTLGEEGVGRDEEPGGGDPGQAGSDARLVTSHIFKAEELRLDKSKKASFLVCLLPVISRQSEKLRVIDYLD